MDITPRRCGGIFAKQKFQKGLECEFCWAHYVVQEGLYHYIYTTWMQLTAFNFAANTFKGHSPNICWIFDWSSNRKQTHSSVSVYRLLSCPILSATAVRPVRFLPCCPSTVCKSQNKRPSFHSPTILLL